MQIIPSGGNQNFFSENLLRSYFQQSRKKHQGSEEEEMIVSLFKEKKLELEGFSANLFIKYLYNKKLEKIGSTDKNLLIDIFRDSVNNFDTHKKIFEIFYYAQINQDYKKMIFCFKHFMSFFFMPIPYDIFEKISSLLTDEQQEFCLEIKNVVLQAHRFSIDISNFKEEKFEISIKQDLTEASLDCLKKIGKYFPITHLKLENQEKYAVLQNADFLFQIQSINFVNCCTLNDETFSDFLKKLPILKTLSIKNGRITKISDTLKKLSLEKLCVENCTYLKEICLTDLKYLEMNGCDYVDRLVVPNAKVSKLLYVPSRIKIFEIGEWEGEFSLNFYKLYFLKKVKINKVQKIEFLSCENLENISVGTVEEIIVKNAEKLKKMIASEAQKVVYENCPKLKAVNLKEALSIQMKDIPFISECIAPEATEIILIDCKSLVSINSPKAKKININFCYELNGIEAPELEELTCINCSSLKKIQFFHIKKLEVFRCESLKKIYLDEPEILHIKDCDSLSVLHLNNLNIKYPLIKFDENLMKIQKFKGRCAPILNGLKSISKIDSKLLIKSIKELSSEVYENKEMEFVEKIIEGFKITLKLIEKFEFLKNNFLEFKNKEDVIVDFSSYEIEDFNLSIEYSLFDFFTKQMFFIKKKIIEIDSYIKHPEIYDIILLDLNQVLNWYEENECFLISKSTNFKSQELSKLDSSLQFSRNEIILKKHEIIKIIRKINYYLYDLSSSKKELVEELKGHSIKIKIREEKKWFYFSRDQENHLVVFTQGSVDCSDSFLGEGDFGTVHRITDLTQGKFKVLKVAKTIGAPEKNLDIILGTKRRVLDVFNESIKKEHEKLNKVGTFNQPGIQSHSDLLFNFSDLNAYTTKIYNKGSLDSNLNLLTNLNLQTSQYIHLMKNLFLGLKTLHSQDMIHGDIKPCNSLLNLTYDSENQPILDLVFGDLGGVMEKEELRKKQNPIPGISTPGFYTFQDFQECYKCMDPRRFNDWLELQKKRDTFALATTCWFLISGNYPYDTFSVGGKNWPATGKLNKAAEVKLKFGKEIFDFFIRALAENPHHRPSSEEVFEKLNDWEQNPIDV